MRRNGTGRGGGGGFKPAGSSINRTKPPRNSSILNFFKKSEHPPSQIPQTQRRITDFGNSSPRDNNNNNRVGANNKGVSGAAVDDTDSLFFEDGSTSIGAGYSANSGVPPSPRRRSKTPDGFWGSPEKFRKGRDQDRFNENGGSGIKKRKVTHSSGGEVSPTTITRKTGQPSEESSSSGNRANGQKARRRTGPFIDESDSEDDLENSRDSSFTPAKNDEDNGTHVYVTADKSGPTDNEGFSTNSETLRMREDNGNGPTRIDNLNDGLALEPREDSFQGPNTAVNEVRDEEIQDPAADVNAYDFGRFDVDSCTDISNVVTETAVCPVCQTGLGDITDMEIAQHVNDCLDGNIPPVPPNISSTEPSDDIGHPEPINRSATARPGQQNPIQLGSSAGVSAFSKIMSGNAEDTAWATAAAREISSRGKPSYERTCPFYKILPGCYICVDAFRYGAVEGCNAYFLSHFHSDHYIGLTSTWRHGMIYCSRVTGNLVRQQLKVDPKWIVDLEFEKKVEVPNTEGVQVTMIPANHCPGSSLFLYEKTMGTGPNPRMHRVLHCGDFRACPSHVQHPLLRPDVLDKATGQNRQQKIDVCYLDTTYLNPRFAFPSQQDVITACAEMCVSLSKDRADHLDLWEKSKRERAGVAMSKFVSKKEKVPTEDSTNSENHSSSRGRLLVVLGTYSIGKERICVGIAKALGCKIYAPPPKQRICACLEDTELSSLLTTDPLDAQVHMQSLMELRPETLSEYLTSLKPHFSRIVAFRPTGWNYRPPAGRMIDNPPVSTVLHSDNWKTRFKLEDLVPQRGSTKESSCFSVPYSEHSSFRELTMFCCALRIARVIPTVNVGSAKSRERMKAWIDRWEAERRKNGLFKVEEDAEVW